MPQSPEPDVEELRDDLDAAVRDFERIRDAGYDPASREYRAADHRWRRLHDRVEGLEIREAQRAALNTMPVRDIVARIPRW